ncbi:MAG: choice-of-anchor D domain-containing protein [Leptospiraceae bacterium]|nr:choice-of-anchor D domain-containing protein [Leptospiraceae bacterium]MCP5499907.1 choice-of-anchor D domain-containing protein [Leptospiraceae bacterium]
MKFLLRLTFIIFLMFHLHSCVLEPTPSVNLKNLLVIGNTSTPDISISVDGQEYLSGSAYQISSSPGNSSFVTFTLSNLGNLDLNIEETSPSLSGEASSSYQIIAEPVRTISAGSSSSFVVSYTPSSSGTFNATLTISSNDPDEGTYIINIKGLTTGPEIEVSQNSTSISSGGSYDFGALDPGNYSTRTFTINNTGDSELSLSGVSLSGANAASFSVEIQPAFNISASGFTSFSIKFSSIVGGTYTATLTILSNDSDEGTFTIQLTGTGLGPEINLVQGSTNLVSGTSYYDFGNQGNASSSEVITFTIQNTGNTDLVLSGSPVLSFSGANSSDFSIISQASSPVAASSNTTFSLQFTPSGLGQRQATLSIANNDSDESLYVINLRGYGLNDGGCALIKTGTNLDKIIFMTATKYNGNLGGVSAADSKCNSDANAPKGKTFKALLGGTARSLSKDWPLQANIRYFKTDGTCIFKTNSSSIHDFTGGNWQASMAGSAAYYWTGLTTTFALSGINCDDWTNSSSGDGTIGFANKSDSDAIEASSALGVCNWVTKSLLCIEQ